MLTDAIHDLLNARESLTSSLNPDVRPAPVLAETQFLEPGSLTPLQPLRDLLEGLRARDLTVDRHGRLLALSPGCEFGGVLTSPIGPLSPFLLVLRLRNSLACLREPLYGLLVLLFP